ncbi:RelA/SpoT domain-containing protein [Nocardiopsis dassonvillei]|uniref:RelA/SpoT domain-containing protein n=1 Tax=Nocardiopsis dassonvillei TaxID=2014 RepID=UPI00157D0E97|nr:RelA/SpoT domain-containing protein [Nocardiopsis dassonvillei]
MVSKSRVDKAGRVLRKYAQTSTELLDEGEVDQAWQVLREYRTGFAKPLATANMGLRSYVRTVTQDSNLAPVQRLKQPRRIMEKLARFTIRLSQMEDIGGCRVVLPDLDTVQRVTQRIEATGRIAWCNDYNEKPQPTGYRAFHIVASYDSHLIEIQLRTPRQQSWAEHVEALDGILGTALKDGGGPEELGQYLRLASAIYAARDTDPVQEIDSDLRLQFEQARQAAQDYVTETRWKKR